MRRTVRIVLMIAVETLKGFPCLQDPVALSVAAIICRPSRLLASFEVQHALGPLLVHDTMTAFPATDGFSWSDLVGSSAVGANVLHHRIARCHSTQPCAAAWC